MLALDLLRFRNGRAQAYGQVVREMISADGNRGSVAYHAATVHHQLGGAAANIEQAAAQFALVLGQAGFRRGQGLKHRIGHHDAGPVHRRNQVLRGRDRARDDMHINLEALPNHSHRVADTVLGIDHKLLRQHMQHLAIFRQGDIPSRFHSAPHVLAFDVSRAMAQRNAAPVVHPADVAAGNADQRRLHRHAGYALSLLERAPDRADGRVQIDDQAFA